MSDQRFEVNCPRCGHTWHVDLSRLDARDVVIYRDVLQKKSYRVRCPQCGTYVIITVGFEEEKDG